MRFHFVCKSLFLVGIVSCTMLSACAQSLTTAHVLHGGTRCDHVINLIHRYGVNNSIATAGASLGQSSLGGFVVPTAELGDLQIVQVSQIDHGDAACGPRIAVTVQNASTRKVCDFYITAVALFGPIQPWSPNASVSVAEILPGQALELHLQLPIESLSMGNRGGQVIGFSRLVVAIDSFDQLMEADEANNVQAFDAAALPVVAAVAAEAVVEATVEATVESTVEATTSIESDVSPEASVEQTEATTVVPDASATVGATRVAKPRNPDALRSAIDRLGSAPAVTAVTSQP